VLTDSFFAVASTTGALAEALLSLLATSYSSLSPSPVKTVTDEESIEIYFPVNAVVLTVNLAVEIATDPGALLKT
jgi:hypothetical protein